MQTINMITIYYWNKKQETKKNKKHVLEADYNNSLKNILLISLVQRMHFLQKFQMTSVALVSVLFCFVFFYGISTIVGYLMPNPFYTYKQFYFKQFSLV